MKNNNSFLNKTNETTNIDDDIIRGRRLTDKESLLLLFQDIYFNEEEFNKAIEPYINWK